MRLRDARADDLPTIVELYNQLLATTTYEWTEEPHTLAGRTDWLAVKRAGGWPVVVAVDETDGGVVGVATYGDFRDTTRWPGYRPTVEHSIHVRQSHWGRGVGRLLLDDLLRRAAADGRHVMIGAIDGSNTDSIAFHLRCGFTEVARMPELGLKFGRRCDLVLMHRFVTTTERRA